MALDNRAVDDLRLSVLDVGLLALALRCPDGAQFTVESTARKRKPGREALTRAMRNLVTCGYVVKLKIQDASTGKWRTEFSVADLPFSRDDVAGMLADIVDARAIRIEPAWLDPRAQSAEQPPAPSRRTGGTPPARVTGSRNSGATSTNSEESQVEPTDGFPTVGEPIVGNPSAQEERLHVQDSSLSCDRKTDGEDSSVPVRAERETAPAQSTAPPGARRVPEGVARAGSPSAVQPADDTGGVGNQVAEAWSKAREQRGCPVPVLGVRRLARSAAALAASGTPQSVLVQAAVDMARHPAWLDLERHLERWAPPAARPSGGEEVPYCDECEYGWITDEDGRARKCACRTRGGAQ
ncbi:hypothetical protein OHA27_38110 [Streptomyces sp. NBC_01619]|uniref:hypothetical protein n=1 Tax=Streptomyces sp. NBC_01619 TaxID=2975901 RepID=UPI00225A09F4|nr:hypothetical protein [Streptomyces sp. NBC_01619]MCX4515935.1 hypothetical protein [Streptomyces sp. NBC_01619]